MLPLQLPDAVQLVALALLHVNVDDPPLATVVVLALSVRVGAGAGVVVTVTIVEALAEPPEPLQDSENVVVAAIEAIDWVPLVDLLPVQPPEAVQLVALVVLHFRVVLPPAAMDEGLDDSVTVGVGVETAMSTELDELPPAPEHVSVNVLEACSAPVDALPDTGLVPLQPPEAVHVSALAVLQFSVDEAPLLTAVGLADMEMAGRGLDPELDPPEPPQAARVIVVSNANSVRRGFIAECIRFAGSS